MTQKYEHEALLRPAVELYAAAGFFMSAIIMIIASEWFLMPPIVAISAAIAFLVRGIQRFRQGSRIKRYQSGLLALSMFVKSSTDLVISKKYQYLGEGFLWDQRHAQRITEFNLPKNKEYREDSSGYEWARRFEYKYEQTKIAAFLGSQHHFNPFSPKPPIGGDPYLHGVGMWEGEKPVLMLQSDRNGHVIVIGTTRVGKTRLAELKIAQDIARGATVIVFDPKGDGDLLQRVYSEAKRAGRENEFHMFHLGYPTQSAAYNPVGNFVRVTEVATRIARQMPGEGQSATFREFVWGYVNIVAKLMNKLGKKPDYSKIKRYSEDVEPLVMEFLEQHFTINADKLGDWEAQVEIDANILAMPSKDRPFDFTFRTPKSMYGRDTRGIAMFKFYKDNIDILNDDYAHSAVKAYQMDHVHMGKLIASLDPFLEKMTTGAVSELIAPDFQDKDREVFDWNTVIQQRGIVYVGLDALSDAEVASAVGNSMFADLTSIAGRLYKYGNDYGLPTVGKESGAANICIHADEFNEIAGDEFVPMLNKAGGAGIQVTAYTQTIPDIEAKIGNKAKAKQMLGNFNTVIMLRVLEEETAQFVVQRQSQVAVEELKSYSSLTENPDADSDRHYTSASQTRLDRTQVNLIEPSHLTRLPKGQAFAWLDGNKVYKIRLPLPDDRDLDNVPNSIAQIGAEMNEKYQSSNDDWFEFDEYFSPVESLNIGSEQNEYGTFISTISEPDDLPEPRLA